MSEKIVVPILGESITEATVARWLKNVGEPVEADQPIVELETDKVNLEVPSPVKGVLTEINSKDGSVVEVGALLGLVSEGEVTASVNKEEIDKKEDNVIKLDPSKKDTKIFEEKKIENIQEEPLILGSIFFISSFLTNPTEDPFSETAPNNAPTSTTEPSFEFISVKTPVIGDGTSKFTLSVSSSTIGSSASTVSPAFFNHLATVASVILSPRAGTTIFSLIFLFKYLVNYFFLLRNVPFCISCCWGCIWASSYIRNFVIISLNSI